MHGGKVLGSPPTTQQKQARGMLHFYTGKHFLEAVVRELPHPTPTCVGLGWCSVPEQSDSTEAHRRVEPPVVGLKVGVVRRWRRPDLQTIGGWGPTSKLLKVKT